jgi:hypothetical protein
MVLVPMPFSKYPLTPPPTTFVAFVPRSAQLRDYKIVSSINKPPTFF